mmetsp:Transcript_95/g.295  ORF Transcript_95/g.295 Transcript_95/m.295 type:complete len:341 (+) Transcript_95:363-1385(+)
MSSTCHGRARHGSVRSEQQQTASPTSALRRSAHEASATNLRRLVGSTAIVLIFHLGLLVERPLKQLVELMDARVVSLVCGGVRVHHHPLARHVLGRHCLHSSSDVTASPFWKQLQPGAEPLGPGSLVRLGVKRRPQQAQKRLVRICWGGVVQRQLGQLSPQESVVHAVVDHQVLQVREQRCLRGSPGREAQFSLPHGVDCVLHRLWERVELDEHLATASFVAERQDGGGKRLKVLAGSGRLVHEREVLTSTGPHVPSGLKLFDETERTVVHGAAGRQAVVGVEVALAEANTQPVGDEGAESLCNLFHQQRDLLLKGNGGGINLWVLAEQQMLDNEFQLLA